MPVASTPESPGARGLRIVAAFLAVVVGAVLTQGCVGGDSGSITPGETSLCLLGVPGETYVSQACMAVLEPPTNKVKFAVEAGPETLVETGLVRTRESHPYRGEFRFRVYRKDGLRKRMLVDSTRRFALNDMVRFRIDGAQVAARAGSPSEIVYEITAVASPGEAIDGYEGYRDFSYIEPAVYEKSEPQQLNLLLVSFDTLRADHLGSYGYELDTSPRIDEFAARSIRFEQAISPAPWTTPAHYSLFTGLNPSAHQNRRNMADLGFYQAQRTLASTLQENGYYTIGLTGGGSISSRFGFAKGFNVYKEYMSLSNTTYPDQSWDHEDDTKKIFVEAMDWLEQNRESKFFMFLHTFECHDPYEKTSFLASDSSGSLIEKRRALYDGDIRHADEYFGRLMDKLETLGLADNTLIVFLSDHGDDFYDHYRETDIVPALEKAPVPEISDVDHAHSLYDELLHVPLIVHIPWLEPAAQVIGNPVGLIDVLPTLTELLSVEHEAPVQGTSLYGLIRNGTRAEDPPILAEFLDLGPERQAIRKDGYKYIWIENLDQLHNDRSYKNLRQHELFDLKSDPAEQRNVYPSNRELAARYHELLQQELEASATVHRYLRQSYSPSADEAIEPDEEILRQLKALGYVQ